MYIYIDFTSDFYLRCDGKKSIIALYNFYYISETTSLNRSRNPSLASLGSVGKGSVGSGNSQNHVYNNVPTKKAVPINKLQSYIAAMNSKKGFEKEYKVYKILTEVTTVKLQVNT